MDDTTVKRLGLILAIQAEIEGMKADNKMNEYYKNTPRYAEYEFKQKADELRSIVSCPGEKL